MKKRKKQQQQNIFFLKISNYMSCRKKKIKENTKGDTLEYFIIICMYWDLIKTYCINLHIGGVKCMVEKRLAKFIRKHFLLNEF